MKVEVVTPEEHMGDVIGDLNARRGTVTDFVDKPGNLRLIRAFVPLSEMFSYISNLRGVLPGRPAAVLHAWHLQGTMGRSSVGCVTWPGLKCLLPNASACSPDTGTLHVCQVYSLPMNVSRRLISCAGHVTPRYAVRSESLATGYCLNWAVEWCALPLSQKAGNGQSGALCACLCTVAASSHST